MNKLLICQIFHDSSQVDRFLSSYLVANEVLTWVDLERDIVSYLRSMSVGNIQKVCGNSVSKESPGIDPNEIDLDLDIGETATDPILDQPQGEKIPQNFIDFGIGKLIGHPLLIEKFGILHAHSDIERDKYITKQDILKHLHQYLILQKFSFSLDLFIQYLCQGYEVRFLLNLGVVFQSDLHELVHTMKECMNNHFYQLYSYLAHERKLSQQFSQEIEQEIKSLKAKKRSQVKWIQSSELKIPQNNPILYSFLNQITAVMQSKSAFSPTFTSIKQEIKSFVSNSRSNNHYSNNKYRKKRKRPQQQSTILEKPNIDTEESIIQQEHDPIEPLIEAATEYIFLHLGKKEDIAKRYIIEEKNSENEDAATFTAFEFNENISFSSQKEEELGVQVHHDNDIQSNSPVIDESKMEDGIPTLLRKPDPISNLTKVLFETKKFNFRHNRESDENILYISNEQLQPILSNIWSNRTIKNSSSNDLERKSKSIEQQKDIGRLGECVVYQYLKHHLLSFSQTENHDQFYQIQWVNEISDENKAPYDIVIESMIKSSDQFIGSRKTFVEVKSTKYEDYNVFNISYWEWLFLIAQPRITYHLYRVYSVLDPCKTHLMILKDVPTLLSTGKIQLCLSI
jgi:hypothetical protein